MLLVENQNITETDPELSKCPPIFPKYSALRVCEDHILIGDKIPILRVPYYEKRLGNLPSYVGFAPRWYVPHETFKFASLLTPVTLTMNIFDTKKENYMGIGYDWPPIILGRGELMIQKVVLENIGSFIGDKVILPMDFSRFFGKQALFKLFALMVFEINDLSIDFESQEIILYQNVMSNFTKVPLSTLGLSPEDYLLNFNFTVTQTYDESNAKFNLIFENSAIMECTWVFPEFLDTLSAKAAE